MATLIVECENFSRMMISFCLEPNTGVDRSGPLAPTQVSGHPIHTIGSTLPL
jgi:hypothetical protein